MCKFFKDLDEVLGPRPATQPPVVYESSATIPTPADLPEDDVYASDGKD